MRKVFLMVAWAILIVTFAGCHSVQPDSCGLHKESGNAAYLHYEDFASSLNVQRFKEGYPALIEKLSSNDQRKRIAAIQTIGASGETDAIPLLVPLVLEDQNSSIAIWAGSALEKIVSGEALKRRDFTRQDQVVILPLKDEDLDLRPLAWVIKRMLEKPDDGSMHSYAATMIGYLGLKEFEPDLRQLLQSRHPAVTGSAEYALQLLKDSR